MKQLVQCFHRQACDPRVFWLNGHLWVKEKNKNPKLQKQKEKKNYIQTQNKRKTILKLRNFQNALPIKSYLRKKELEYNLYRTNDWLEISDSKMEKPWH